MISLSNITLRFGETEVFRDFSLNFQTGKINCLLGPSGCGKTSLLNLIAGIIQPHEGVISGKDGDEISYIFQETTILPWKTVEQNVLLPLLDKMQVKRALALVEKHLRLVQLWEHRKQYPYQLSGGMKQRVSIARAFAFPAKVVLMDEAFQGLDMHLKQHLLDLFLQSWKDNPITVIFVTHDLEEAVYLGQSIHILSKPPISDTTDVAIPLPPGTSGRATDLVKQGIIESLGQQ